MTWCEPGVVLPSLKVDVVPYVTGRRSAVRVVEMTRNEQSAERQSLSCPFFQSHCVRGHVKCYDSEASAQLSLRLQSSIDQLIIHCIMVKLVLFRL